MDRSGQGHVTSDRMTVGVDNLWSTPSALHMRVTVWGPGGRWRHKYEQAISYDDIPEEALECMLSRFWAAHSGRDPEQLPLF